MSLVQFSVRPLYLQVRDALAERITTGEWKPGIAIPNEGDLAREFGVSPGTMRKALGLMEGERLLTRRPGRGTFVNDQASDGLASRFCNIRSVSGGPVVGQIETGEITQAAASEAECSRLQLRSHDKVWRVRRLRLSTGRPFMWEEATLPAELFPGLGDRKCTRIAVLAQQYGLLLGKAEERISIAAASRDVAEALHVAQGAPIVVLDRVVRTIDGRPVEWRIGQCDLAENYYSAQMN